LERPLAGDLHDGAPDLGLDVAEEGTALTHEAVLIAGGIAVRLGPLLQVLVKDVARHDEMCAGLLRPVDRPGREVLEVADAVGGDPLLLRGPAENAVGPAQGLVPVADRRGHPAVLQTLQIELLELPHRMLLFSWVEGRALSSDGRGVEWVRTGGRGTRSLVP